MTKLEPTRTNSDLMATERLRELLDERGVEWRETVSDLRLVITWWESPTFGEVHAIDNEDGTLFMDCLNSCDFTPEQAIAATLGRGMLTADDVRDLIERHSDASGDNGRDFHNGAYVAIADELNAMLGSCNCSNSERTDVPCLPHFWTHAPTVEDVLREMADRCYADEDEPRDRDAIVAEYAAKLCLAGDAE